MSERKEKIAELYYRSSTVKFDLERGFELSIHKDHPELPRSPWYLHYPVDDQPGIELLPELFELIGEEFHDMSTDLAVDGLIRRVTGQPNGAIGIGREFARQRDPAVANFLRFFKIQHPDGTTELAGPLGVYDIGDELWPVEDHISGGRNNKLFVAASRRRGFIVKNLFVVVDRQQGGPENLAAEGVTLRPIFTADELLDYGQAENIIDQNTYDVVQEYRAANQFSLVGLEGLEPPTSRM